MTPFTGQTENAGHFLQPTTNAIGHKVIALLLRSLRVHQAEREDAHERYCGRVGVEIQTNTNGIRGRASPPSKSGDLSRQRLRSQSVQVLANERGQSFRAGQEKP